MPSIPISLIQVSLGVCLVLMYLLDSFQVALRIIAAASNTPILGVHLASVAMLFNRAATAIALLAIGYMVDSRVGAIRLLEIYGLVSLLIAVGHGIFLKKRLLLNLTACAFRLLYKVNIADGGEFADAPLATQSKRRVDFWMALVGTVALLGFILPSVAASQFPAYRATLLQTGFIVNSIASIVNVVHVERHISMTLEKGSLAESVAVYDAFILSRSIGYAVSVLPILLLGLAL